MSSKPPPLRKGSEAERELVRKLWKHGFAAMRAPASGAKASKIFYPDVIAIYKGRIFVFEVKMREKMSGLSIDRAKLLKLVDFAERAGGEPYIAFRVKSSRKWLIIKLDRNLVNNSGSKKYVRIARDYISKNAISLDEFINRVLNVQLEVYMKDD